MGPGPGPWVGHARHFHHGMGWGGWVLWILFIVAFWVLVIAAVIWLVRSITGRGTANRRVAGGPPWAATHTGPVPPAGPQPEQILSERFARGEIEENEYRTRLAVLRGEPVSAAPPPPPANPPEAPPPAP